MASGPVTQPNARPGRQSEGPGGSRMRGWFPVERPARDRVGRPGRQWEGPAGSGNTPRDRTAGYPTKFRGVPF